MDLDSDRHSIIIAQQTIYLCPHVKPGYLEGVYQFINVFIGIRYKIGDLCR